MNSINLSELSLKGALRVMMEGSDIKTYKELADKLNINEYTFRSALHNDALRTKELLKAAEILGYEIKLEKK